MDRIKSGSGLNDSRIDYALILPVLLLIIIGFVALWFSLTTDYPDRAQTMLLQQGTWLILGIVAAFFVMHFDSMALWNIAPFLYVIGLILMIVPIFFYSPEVVRLTGAKSWITINGSTLFQPSELMKVAYILFTARLIVNFRKKNPQRNLKTDLFLILEMTVSFLPIIYILVGYKMQNDFGTLLVFFAIFAGLLLISGVSWKILLPIIIFFILSVSLLLYIVMTENGQEILSNLGFQSYQSARFQAWLHPFDDVQRNSYQQSQSLIATAMGSVFGVGMEFSEISVPVRESDMIFTVISGMTGFVGSSVVIFLYLYLIYRMMRATLKANNLFYTFIAGGFTMMLLFHVFENIGATIGLLPLTGIPLPFISQGGSNLISNIVGIGLILSIQYNQSNPTRQDKTRTKYQRRLAKKSGRVYAERKYK
ncbi:MAG: FtsW/RodA/SpoVE family cell cycle protein [Lactovum sp.]